MGSTNAWLSGYIADYNRRFAVVPKDPSDAHLAYLGTSAELVRTLSVQVTRTLSKSFSCQYDNPLLQIKTTGTGLGRRGKKVTAHEHFDGRKELLWKKRQLAYTMMDKPRRRTPVADSKSVNARVDKAMVRRDPGRKPAPSPPWRSMPTGKLANDGRCATL
jgi:hypothetical protein